MEILSLNDEVKCKIGVSMIEGVGVIAIRDIKKGEKMYCKEGSNTKKYQGDISVLRPEIQELILQRWTQADKNFPFPSPNDDARLISFMNHSDTPNYDKYNDIALKDILKGQEITEKYDTLDKL